MIYSTAKLVGGLGNQMFEIAHACAQGWKAGVPSIFEPVSTTPMQGYQPTTYLSTVYRKIAFFNGLSGYKVVKQERFEYQDCNTVFNQPIQFDGHYQSKQFFLGYENKVRDLFISTRIFKHSMRYLYPTLTTGSISMHIRRGDYLSVGDVLPVLTKSYFDKALSLHGNYKQLFVFSDDKEWVKNNLFYPNMIVVEGLLDWEELWLMSLCEHNIISNSSFSWWASFLNENKNKKIYAPSVWFGPQGESKHSLVEQSWVSIPVYYSKGQLLTV